MKLKIYKYILIIFFIFGVLYTLLWQTEKYASVGTVMVQDLSNEQSVSAIGALLTNSPQDGTRDSMVLDIYIRSNDMFQKLDREFNLSQYYTGKEIDFLQRLYPNVPIDLIRSTQDNFLMRYNQDIITLIDTASSTFQIGFHHADPKLAKMITERLIQHAFNAINHFERENGRIALEFLEKQAAKNRKLFIKSVQKLIEYQNKHHTIDPNADIQMDTTLISQLEGELIKNEVAYRSRLVHKPASSPSMRILKNSIQQIREQIDILKKGLSGKQNNKALNANAFEFEMLKNESALTREIYKQTLIKLEEAKVNASKSAKNLTIITHPTVAELYSSPKKFRQILSLFIILGFLYGIVALIISIIQSHRD